MITPVFREEFFLDAIINGTTPPDPVFRVEYFLAKIAGADVETPTPIFRIEKYLAKIGGDDVEIPDPVFREEYWLAKKCGENVTTPTPVFRLEYFLEEWVNGSAPAYQSVTGKIVSFITQRIAPLKIEASLSPIQDLHGYDAPWPPGGGKQMLNYSLASLGATTTSFNYGINLTANQEYTFGYYGSENVNIICYLHRTSTRLFTSGYTKAYTYTPTEDETIDVSFYITPSIESAENLFQLEKGPSKTTFSPYSNECPISGHTGATVVRTGKNQLGGLPFALAMQDVAYAPQFSIDTDAKTFTFTRGVQSGIGAGYENPILEELVGGQYTAIITYSNTANNSSICFKYTDGTKDTILLAASNGQKTIVAVTSDSAKTLLNVELDYFSNGSTTVYYEESGFFPGALTADQFETYSGTTVTVNFGSTVYGGTLTVNEDGSGQVNDATYPDFLLDLGTRNWTKSGVCFYTAWAATDANIPLADTSADITNAISSQYKATSRDLIESKDFAFSLHKSGTATYLTVTDSRFSDEASFKTGVSGATVCYPLATPQEFPVSPGQVNALQGQNVVWVDDSGEIKVTYRSN